MEINWNPHLMTMQRKQLIERFSSKKALMDHLLEMKKTSALNDKKMIDRWIAELSRLSDADYERYHHNNSKKVKDHAKQECEPIR